LHRVGRTGRFGTDGIALTIVENDIDELQISHIKKIADVHKMPITQV